MTQEEYEKFTKIQQEAQQEAMRQQAELMAELQRAQRQAARTQDEINTRPRRQYASIVAVDLRGGFSKEGQIPWHYAADFKWFQDKTKGHVCVMGRTTYDDINKRLGEKAAENVLPNRTCFVVTSRPLERNNATAIASLSELDFALDKQNVPYEKTVFFCGGERIYQESISKADVVYMTVVNKDIGCDRFFPKFAIQKQFYVANAEAVEGEPDLRFVTWKRQGT